MKKFFIAMAVFLTVCISITGCFDSDFEDNLSQDDKVITADVESDTNLDSAEIATSKVYFTSADILEAAASTAATIFTSETTTIANVITTPAETAAATSASVTATTTVTTATTTVTTTTTTPAPDISYSNVVYIAASGKGKKYHNNPKCSNMKGNVASLSIENAVARGYTPCKKCYG